MKQNVAKSSSIIVLPAYRLEVWIDDLVTYAQRVCIVLAGVFTAGRHDSEGAVKCSLHLHNSPADLPIAEMVSGTQGCVQCIMATNHHLYAGSL